MLKPENKEHKKMVLLLLEIGLPVFKYGDFRLVLSSILKKACQEIVADNHASQINELITSVNDYELRSKISSWFCDRAPLISTPPKMTLRKKKAPRKWSKVNYESFSDLDELLSLLAGGDQANDELIDFGSKTCRPDEFASTVADALVLNRKKIPRQDLQYLSEVVGRVQERMKSKEGEV